MATKTAEKLPKSDQGWQSYLQNRKPPEEREWLPLGHGLVVCISPSGDRAFQARLRRIGDKHARRVTIGHFPEVSVAEARQRLLAARAAAKEGRDPSLDRRRAREGVETVATFGKLADLYLAERAASGKLRPKTIEMETRAIATLRKALGDRLLADIETQGIATVIRREEFAFAQSWPNREKRQHCARRHQADVSLCETGGLFQSALPGSGAEAPNYGTGASPYLIRR